MVLKQVACCVLFLQRMDRFRTYFFVYENVLFSKRVILKSLFL